MSQLEVDKVIPQSGTTLTLGESGDTITIPSGATFSATLTAPVIDEINDTNGNEEIIFTTTASAVNELTIANAATGNAPEIAATGSDTNIDLKLTPKGSGKLVLDGLSFPNADGSASQVLQTNGSGVLSFGSVGAAAGQVIQVVSTAKTDTASTTSSSYSDISGLNLTITPSSSSNKILIIGDISGASSSGLAGMGLRIKQTISGSDTFPYVGASAGSRTQASFGAYVASDASFQGKFSSSVLLSPNTTSAITYTYQFRSQNANAVYINRSVSDADTADQYRTASSITAMEIKG